MAFIDIVVSNKVNRMHEVSLSVQQSSLAMNLNLSMNDYEMKEFTDKISQILQDLNSELDGDKE